MGFFFWYFRGLCCLGLPQPGFGLCFSAAVGWRGASPDPKNTLGNSGGALRGPLGCAGGPTCGEQSAWLVVLCCFFLLLLLSIFLSSSPPRPSGRRLGLRAAPRLSSPPSCPARRVGPHAGTPGRTTRGNLCCPGGRTRFFSPIRAVRARAELKI